MNHKIYDMPKKYSYFEQIYGYNILDVYGEGTYGICYLVEKDEKLYILKQLKKRSSSIKYEEEILRSINTNRIPKFIKKLQGDRFTGYILEYKKGDTIEDMLYKDKYAFSKEEIADIGLQLINILQYLHGIDIIHGDIRVPNVIYNQGKIYLIDFGLARWIDNKWNPVDIDFYYLADFLLHLYYSSFKHPKSKKQAWYNELKLPQKEIMFLKRLFGIERHYEDIDDVKEDFLQCFNSYL